MVLSENVSSDSSPHSLSHVVTKIFRHDCVSRHCPIRWSIRDNHHDEEKALFEAIATDPIVHRHYLSGKKWLTDSFTIQSPEMRDFLKSALANYQDFDPSLEGWTFSSPYKALVHRWDRILELSESTTKDTEQPVNSLVRFLHPILESYIQAQVNINKTGQISFADIWQVFPPGELVLTTLFGAEIMCRVTSYEFSRAPQTESWTIRLQYVDWNGEKCGFANTYVRIDYYTGERHVASLPVYPAKFCESIEQTKERLLKRGRLFEGLRGYHFKSCSGTQILLEESPNEERPVSGRVIIDAHAYYQSHNMKPPRLESLEPDSAGDDVKLPPGPRSAPWSNGVDNRDILPQVHPDYQQYLNSYYQQPGGAYVQPYQNNAPIPQTRNATRHGPAPAMGYHSGTPYGSYSAQPLPPPPPPPQAIPPQSRRRPLDRNSRRVRRRSDASQERNCSPPPESDYTGLSDDYVMPQPSHDAMYPNPFAPSPNPARPIGRYTVGGDALPTRTKSLNKIEERCETLDPLTDDQCLLTTPWVIGLDMNTKLWGKFRVDELASIAWNEESYDTLILPGKEKELAWAFVKNKALADSAAYKDCIKDKGRGIIILMFGPPGVGKSYTAEAVAERARMPLYTMSAATLGTNPKRVGDSLEYALNLCRAWNAMLLLDEADVFLSSRSDSDLARNELVAVFLTKLEYYQGICFMTTNRMSSIDLAMQSRVDLFLSYSDLTEKTRYSVWNNLITGDRAERFAISDNDLDALSKYKLNGREIKNLVKTAHLLSLGNPDEKIDLKTLSVLVDNRIQALEALKGR